MTLTLTSLWRSVGSRSSWRRWGRTWSSTISCWRQLWWSSSTRTTPTLLTSPPTWSVDINVAHQPLWLFKLQQYLIYFSWFILYIVLFYVFIIDKKIEMSITFIVQIILITRFFCSTVSQNICLCYVKKKNIGQLLSSLCSQVSISASASNVQYRWAINMLSKNERNTHRTVFIS